VTLLDRTTWQADEVEEVNSALGLALHRQGWGLGEPTGSEVSNNFDLLGQVVKQFTPTRPAKVFLPMISVVIVVGDAVNMIPTGPPKQVRGGVPAEDEIVLLEESTESGAPSAALLSGAVRDLQSWLYLTQDQVCRYLRVSRSTVMAWRRDPGIHPRHAQIPLLLHLWAAVSGAREQFGGEATRQRIHQYGPLTDRDHGPEAFAEVLLAAVDEASIRALDESKFSAAAAWDVTAKELETAEEELSDALTGAVKMSSE